MVTGIVFFLGDDKIRARSLLIRQHETTGKNAGVRSGEKSGRYPVTLGDDRNYFFVDTSLSETFAGRRL